MKHFLFLQVPHGPSITKLEFELEKLGHRVTRIVFNPGDWLFSRKKTSIFYRDDISKFDTWLSELNSTYNFTDVVVYGDCRDIHRTAKRVSSNLNFRYWVLEEGYLRPFWVTLDQGGANGYSKIPGQFRRWKATSRISDFNYQETVDQKGFRNSQPFVIFWALMYYGCRFFGDLLFKKYVNHRPSPYFYEFLGWHIKVIKGLFGRNYRSRIKCNKFIKKEKYFFVPLQLVEDSQISTHSPFDTMHSYIYNVLISFSNNSNKDNKLLFKGHPLDSELFNYRRYINKLAYELGISDRVVFVHDGNVPEILNNALGTITINSTVGFQSVHHQCPVICLGTSIYNHSGMTFSGSLDDFWENRIPPNSAQYQLFRHFLFSKCLIPGSFYLKTTSDKLIQGLVSKLTSMPNELYHGDDAIKQIAVDDEIASERFKVIENLPVYKKLVLISCLLLTVITVPLCIALFLVSLIHLRFTLWWDEKKHEKSLDCMDSALPKLR